MGVGALQACKEPWVLGTFDPRRAEKARPSAFNQPEDRGLSQEILRHDGFYEAAIFPWKAVRPFTGFQSLRHGAVDSRLLVPSHSRCVSFTDHATVAVQKEALERVPLFHAHLTNLYHQLDPR